MKVEIIKRETVKPSSPTPPHLRSFKLSFFDQISPLIYVPNVFFYHDQSNEGDKIPSAKRSDQLKKSLSDSLSRYYPFAGRIKEDLCTIDCNDQGVDYIEAHVSCELSKFLQEPEIEVLNHLLPCHFVVNDVENAAPVAFQVNSFECGGLAIGMCFIHKIFDASSLTAFVEDWASTSRGSTEAVPPIFVQDSLFPQIDLSGLIVPTLDLSKTKVTRKTQRFVFDGSNIAVLKAKVMTNSTVKQPTRVEVVSSLIWQRIISASRDKPDWKKLRFAATYVLNIRGRLVPSLPRNTIGNLVWTTSVTSTNESERELVELVTQLRESIRKVDHDCIREFQGDEGSLRFFQDMEKELQMYSPDDVHYYAVTSWCRFPFYEADFGWGKPVWVSSVSGGGDADVGNCIVMMDTRLGDGIEAWVTSDEQTMAVLERDQDLLAFASLNPPVL